MLSVPLHREVLNWTWEWGWGWSTATKGIASALPLLLSPSSVSAYVGLGTWME